MNFGIFGGELGFDFEMGISILIWKDWSLQVFDELHCIMVNPSGIFASF